MTTKTIIKTITFLLVLLVSVCACGCLGVTTNTPAEPTPPLPATPYPSITPTPEPTIPPIEDVAFYIHGQTTLLPSFDVTSEDFVELYGPVYKLPGLATYTLMTFHDLIPDRGAEAVTLHFSVYGQNYTRILKNTHMGGGLTDVYTYQGRINKSDPETTFFLTVGPGNNLTTGFPWRETEVEVRDIQRGEFAAKMDNHPLHMAYSLENVIPNREYMEFIDPSQYWKHEKRIMVLAPINESELTEYDQIIHIGVEDYTSVPAFIDLVSDTGKEAEVNRDTYLNVIYPKYVGPHKILEINGSYHILLI